MTALAAARASAASATTTARPRTPGAPARTGQASLPQNRDGTYCHRLARPMPLRPGSRRCHGRGRHPPSPAAESPAAGGLSSGSAPTSRWRRSSATLRRGHGRPALDLPRRRRRARSSACCASTTARRRIESQELPPMPQGQRRALAPVAAGRRCCRSTTSRPSSPRRRSAIVTLLEGEKCADIATALGLPHATASAHGAKAPWLSDWSPLAGRPVAILRDEERTGAEYAAKVAAILAALDSARRRAASCVCRAFPTAKTSSSGSRPAADSATATPTSSPSFPP